VSLYHGYEERDIGAFDPRNLKLPAGLRTQQQIGLQLSPLAGQCTHAGVVLNDPVDGKPRLFFVFPTLSVRIIGTYRFKCSLTSMDTASTDYVHCITVLSDRITILPLSEFTGCGEMTTLAKSFATQGIWN
jgi:hypothetical protein